MTISDFNLKNEFENIDFNSKRLEDRFIKAMEQLAREPEKSIWLASGSRSDAKAIYRMLDNEKLCDKEILNTHREAAIKRITDSGSKVILAVQDTTGVNYAGHKKTKGLGYFCDKCLGINVHSCLAVTPEGLVLGLLEQTADTREIRKDETASHDKKKRRPIEEKESFRWLTTMEQSSRAIPPEVKLIHVCDREGDMYELFEKGEKENKLFLVRIVQNRLTTTNEKIIDEIKTAVPIGSIETVIPRDSRRNIPKRTAKLNISYKSFEVKKPYSRQKDSHLDSTVTMNVIYVREEQTDGQIEPIEWILATNDEISSAEEAFEMVTYYIQRWKIERFHYVLKSGCGIEKIQERSADKIVTLILMYSIIAIRIMNMTYLARINPELPCNCIFEEAEWKILYCTANRTSKEPDGPYEISKAIAYLARLGGFVGAKSDGCPGVKVIWLGLNKLNTLIEYREFLNYGK